MTVLNELKPGLEDTLHESALVLELRALGHGVELRRRFAGSSGNAQERDVAPGFCLSGQ